MKKIYTSREWKAVNGYARANILLVNERVKPGATFSVGETKAELAKAIKVLEQLGLSYRVRERRRTRKKYRERLRKAKTPEQKLLYKKFLSIFPKGKKVWVKYGATIAKNRKTLDDFDKESERVKINKEHYRVDGKFYGYTPCSTEAIIKSGGLTYLKEVLKLLKEKKPFPEEFFYYMPDQLPCSLSCKKCRKLARLWKSTLQKYDAKAAKALKEFNKKRYNLGYIEQRISEVPWSRRLAEQEFAEKRRLKQRG